MSEACGGYLTDYFQLVQGLGGTLVFFHGSWWLWLFKLRFLSGLGGDLRSFELQILESELFSLCASQLECGEPVFPALVEVDFLEFAELAGVLGEGGVAGRRGAVTFRHFVN